MKTDTGDEADPLSGVLRATIPHEMAGRRLDQALAGLFTDYSRAVIQECIRSGRVTLDGKHAVPKKRLSGGERVSLRISPPASSDLCPQPIPLTIVYEDGHLIVVDKPAGLVVHPGAGNRDGTLVNALLHYDASLASIPRAGLVHRIDKDTTGLLLVARTLTAHKKLVDAIQSRSIKREYDAIVHGALTGGGRVQAPIGRSRTRRTQMAITATGKAAITHYRVKTRFNAHTHIRIALETGRTHQIRVHMAHLGHPVLGDRTYGGRPRPPGGADDAFRSVLRSFPRQALHASRLAFLHPGDGAPLLFEAPLPPDMRELLDQLAAESRSRLSSGPAA